MQLRVSTPASPRKKSLPPSKSIEDPFAPARWSRERTIYLFATTEAPKLLAPWAEKAGREIEVEMAPDPTWEGLDRWS